ncbi:MAG: homoserine dehydrogenase, partial [Candidatus Omnitrophota bacterium]
MKSVNVGLIGLGTVGGGVYDAIARNGRLISEKAGVSLVIKGVCDKDKQALEKIDCPIKTSSADDL